MQMGARTTGWTTLGEPLHTPSLHISGPLVSTPGKPFGMALKSPSGRPDALVRPSCLPCGSFHLVGAWSDDSTVTVPLTVFSHTRSRSSEFSRSGGAQHALAPSKLGRRISSAVRRR